MRYMRYIPSVILFVLAIPAVVAGIVWQTCRHGFAMGMYLYNMLWELAV